MLGFAGLLLGMFAVGVMQLIPYAVSSEDRTVLSGMIQLGRYFGASIGVHYLRACCLRWV